MITKKKRKLGWEYLRTWVEIFQVGIFRLRIIQGVIYQEGVSLVEVLRVGIFRVGVFLKPNKIYAKNSQVFIASAFNPPPIVIFSYAVEIFPHPLVQLIGH